MLGDSMNNENGTKMDGKGLKNGPVAKFMCRKIVTERVRKVRREAATKIHRRGKCEVRKQNKSRGMD